VHPKKLTGKVVETKYVGKKQIKKYFKKRSQSEARTRNDIGEYAGMHPLSPTEASLPRMRVFEIIKNAAFWDLETYSLDPFLQLSNYCHLAKYIQYMSLAKYIHPSSCIRQLIHSRHLNT